MKKLIEQYYRLIIHSEAQKYSIASMNKSEIKYPHKAIYDDDGKLIEYIYLTESELLASIEGKKSLGLILCKDKEGISKSGCIDIDIPRDCKDLGEALTIAQNIVKEGYVLGVNLYIEYSGNRGFHIWVFLEKAVTPKLIKDFLKSISLRANFTPQEIFPKDVNSNIKLPCTIHLKTKKRCGFITPDFDVNNPQIDLNSQGDLMAKFEVTALDKVINISELEADNSDKNNSDKLPNQSKNNLNETRSKDKSLNESQSNEKSLNEPRSKDEIKTLLNSLGDHPSCIQHLLSNGAPLDVDYNQANLTLIRYCLTRGLDLPQSLPLAQLMAQNTSENHSTSKDYRGKVNNFKSAWVSCDRNSDKYKFECSYILSGIKEGEAHTRGCIGTKCKVHKNHNPNYQSSNSKDRADTSKNSDTPNNSQSSNSKTDNNNSNQGISDSLDYLKVSALIFQSLLNLTSEGKEIIKSQILRECEALEQNYLLGKVSGKLTDSIRLIESEVLGYLLQNPESIIDYSDIFSQGFIATIKKNDSLSEYLDNLYNLKLPSPETIEEYLGEIREVGIREIAQKKYSKYAKKLAEDKADTSIEILSKSIDETEKLINRSISETNLLPTSEKIEGLLTQLLSEDREAIPTFSDDFNTLLNGGFSKGRFYVMSAGPASGKSTLCLQCADYASSKGYKVGYFSFEMSLDQIFITQISRLGEINSGYLDKKIYLKNDSLKLKMFKTVKEYYEQISENIYIIECDDSFTPNKILSIIKKLKLDLVFIDYLQLMNSGDKDIDNNGNETIKISKIATELKRLSRKSDTPIIAISDISKNAFDSTKSGKKSLDMSALRDSFKIAHSADCVMLLHSFDFDNKGEDQIKTQLDYVKNNWQKIDLKVAKYIENIDNKTFLNKTTADIFSRLYIDKNRTGRTGDILFKYSKAIHKFEPLNYLHSNNENKEEGF
ncbi:DnaB-like helicase C-terminal domain-containing protein [Geminocystis sp. CENA526]|uniref:DnaB-like helicase C-terminal domain-containing protein n=1 Tax=Geminocystis sp. CENA526 TaxID=1355871 RepID=UPI003D6FF3DE